MRVILAVNHEQLEDYISSLNEIDVINILRNRKAILSECKESQADLIVISHTLPGAENIRDILTKLTSKNYPNLRIVYLYGEDDNDRKDFVNFLISRGVYDYFIGDLEPETVNQLLFEPKNRDDVKHDIVDTPIINNPIDKEQVIKEAPKTVTVYKPFTLKQKVISFFGPHGAGKTSIAINTALTFAEGLKDSIDTNIILVDLDFKKPDIAYHLDIVDSDRCMDALIPKLKAKTLDVNSLEQYLTIPFKNYPKFKILTGCLDYSKRYKSLEIDELIHLLNTIKNSYDIILLDTDGDIDNFWTQFAYNNSNLNMLVTELNIGMLENIKKQMLKLENDKEIIHDIRKTFLVVNKYFIAKELDTEDIGSCLELEVKAKIPGDIATFTDAINKVRPIALDEKQETEKFRRAFTQICSEIHPITIEEKQSFFKSFLQKFMKKGA